MLFVASIYYFIASHISFLFLYRETLNPLPSLSSILATVQKDNERLFVVNKKLTRPPFCRNNFTTHRETQTHIPSTSTKICAQFNAR